MRRALVPLLLLAACQPEEEALVTTLGAWTLTVDSETGRLTVDGPEGTVLDDLALRAGGGTQSIQWQVGAFRFDDVVDDVSELPVQPFLEPPAPLFREGERRAALGADGEALLVAWVEDDGHLVLQPLAEPLVPEGDTPRFQLEAACEADEHFLGLGSHALDLDHVGEAFGLWVSEAGVNKSESDTPGDDWVLVGTKHASSFPVPFLLRPQQASGLLVATNTRVEVDLCSDSDRWSVTAWDARPQLHLLSAPTPLQVVEQLSEATTGMLAAGGSPRTSRPRRLPGWAFAPWNDAIAGEDRVREVATTLREAGAPSSVIWTEDWKGADPNPTGYRLSLEWDVDTELYPKPVELADDLAADGFAWFAYFSPFVTMEGRSGADAEAADALMTTADGETYTHVSASFRPSSQVDVFDAAGIDWAREKMQAAVDLGFRGWMHDFGEWLPHDSRVGETTPDGPISGLVAHNAYPDAWQAVAEDVLGPVDGVPFCRSGWLPLNTCPVTWLGDQSTDDAHDDGFPTLFPLALGLSASGVPIVTHDVAGYQSFGTEPTSPALFRRWAWLGAFSPILRTHHGSSAFQNHQFDTDAETLAFWAEVATEHMRLWPYRYALAARATDAGTPMLLPTSFVFDGEPWDRADAWMLGDALLVAPALEVDATSREVALPAGVDWYDWWTLEPAQSGTKPAGPEEIPVFVRGGATIPLFDTVPDTLLETAGGDLVTLEAADKQRVVLLVGGGGPFTEADGTTYTPSGTPTEAAEVTATLLEGEVEVGGVTLAISGPVQRRYTVRVTP